MTESLAPVSQGVEQSFVIGQPPAGSGGLEVDVPVSGLTAVALGGDIGLEDATNGLRAVYSSLKVTDAQGKSLPAAMAPTDAGATIAITVSDADAVYPVTVDPTWVWFGTAVASDGAAGDQFGYSVAVSGTTAVVGAPLRGVGGHAGQGAVYVFNLDDPQNGWVQSAELTASDGAAGDEFGYSVAISQGTIVVGSVYHQVGSNSNQGAAYVFSLNDGTWSQSAELSASDGQAGDCFGYAVAAFGTTVAVSSVYHAVSGHSEQGAAYVYSDSNGTWAQTEELTSSDGTAYDAFGYSLAMSANTLAVSAVYHQVGSHTNQGAAYIYTLAGTVWSQAAELTASDGAGGDCFGVSVSVSNTTVVVGAPYHTVGSNPNQGAAYVFAAGSGGAWSQTAELTASDGANGDQFGRSVAISGPNVAVEAPNHNTGSHYGVQYTFSDSASGWSQNGELTDIGWAVVSLSGDNLVVGDPYVTVGGNADQGEGGCPIFCVTGARN